MSASQPQAAGAAQQPQQLLKADDILKLTCLTEDEKQKYRLLMHNTWNMVNQHAQGSAEHTQARQKLQEFSQRFIARERQHRIKQKQAQTQGGQGNSNQPATGAQQPSVKQEAPALNRAAEGITTNQPSQGQQQPPNPAQSRPASTPHVDPSIVKHVHDFPFMLPPAITPGTPEAEAKMKEYKNGYLNMLAKQAQQTENIKKIQAQIQERQKTGQEISPDLVTAKNRVEKEYYAMKNQIEKFRGLQKQWKDERDQRQGQQPTPQPQQPAAQPPQGQQGQQNQQQPQPQRQPSLSGMGGQGPVKEEPQVKVEGGQTTSQPAPQFNMPNQPQTQSQQNPSQAPTHQQQQQQQQQQPQQGQRQPPNMHMPMPPNPNQQQQFGQQQQQQQQQPTRPQINPYQPNMQQHQQSNSPHPQSATTANPTGPPVALSHQAAVSAANRSYTDVPRTSTPMQQGGPGSFHAPGSREREQLNNPKMPIPRHLNVTSPMPVNMGQQRPTMSGPTNGAPGPMGQPVISRPPPFQLEGEGDRVLSKRKLDELVRQVTGGSEEALTPEVEEVSALLPLYNHEHPPLTNPGCSPACRRFCRQRHRQCMQAFQAARLSPARRPRHPARARAQLQHPHPWLRLG
jgi:transcription initiation factor TFIID subunit 12